MRTNKVKLPAAEVEETEMGERGREGWPAGAAHQFAAAGRSSRRHGSCSHRRIRVSWKQAAARALFLRQPLPSRNAAENGKVRMEESADAILKHLSPGPPI